MPELTKSEKVLAFCIFLIFLVAALLSYVAVQPAALTIPAGSCLTQECV